MMPSNPVFYPDKLKKVQNVFGTFLRRPKVQAHQNGPHLFVRKIPSLSDFSKKDGPKSLLMREYLAPKVTLKSTRSLTV